LIYLGHDLAHRRVAAGDQLEAPAWDRRAEVVRVIEERSWALADLSVYPEASEAAYVESIVGEGRAMAMVPYLLDDAAFKNNAAVPGREVCFVGGPLHAPNLDGLRWFRDEVHRDLFRAGELGQLHVFGYWRPDDLDGDLEGVTLHGPLSDAELDLEMSRCRLAVAPLRFGAGVKRKVVHYLSLGLPLVATEVAMEGIHPDPDGQELCLLADTSEEWRSALLRLRDDQVRREQQAAAGLRAVAAGYTRGAYHRNLEEVLATALDRRRGRGGSGA
jgi:glycosyltransferase involved in cell wall biosynthesis